MRSCRMRERVCEGIRVWRLFPHQHECSQQLERSYFAITSCTETCFHQVQTIQLQTVDSMWEYYMAYENGNCFVRVCICLRCGRFLWGGLKKQFITCQRFWGFCKSFHCNVWLMGVGTCGLCVRVIWWRVYISNIHYFHTGLDNVPEILVDVENNDVEWYKNRGSGWITQQGWSTPCSASGSQILLCEN